MSTPVLPNGPSDSPVKILTVGAAVGNIRELFTKIKAIDAKHGKFDFALCVGDFFGPVNTENLISEKEGEIQELLDGKIEAPMRCYIMQGEHPLPWSVIQSYTKTSGELCKDVFLLNKQAVLTTAHGLRIACLGGKYDGQEYTNEQHGPPFSYASYTSANVEQLLSNSLTKTASANKAQSYTSLAAIRDAASSSSLVDILLSHDWPSAVTQFSAAPLAQPDLAPAGVHALDEVVRKVKPRYHFSAGGGSPPQFWEREPYVWNDEQGRVSRFVSLGAFGGESSTGGKKPRWFYAFSIQPSGPASARPANATKNPFIESVSRPPKRHFEDTDSGGGNYIWGNVGDAGKRMRTGAGPGGPPQKGGKPPSGYKCKVCESTEHFINDCPDREKPPESYICKICNTPGHFVRDCPTRHQVGDTGGRKPREGYVCRACGSELHYIDDCPTVKARPAHEGRGKRGPPKEITSDECWFCLSNPNIAKHLIVSIGTECYLSLPKGQIPPTQGSAAASHPNAPRIPGGGHVLIIPITHQPSYSTIPAALAPPILAETDAYKRALRALYAKHGAAAVFFEVARLSAKGGHAHVQAVPVPLKLRDSVERAFRAEGQLLNVDFEADADAALAACAGGRGSYFRVDLPDGGKLVHLIKEHVPFGIQFGRQVLVTLLDMADRFDWKACTLSEEEDKADAQAFKSAFAPFDPSL
ncbi:hypothetical protein CONPUDRAFT_134710 [Coniophora puteana RWD-64-598 SS2]|uniref:CCHC-type domain-containing protein n=1 Tax=Coniophora puteana (strain RWD-64-598) TaxID=741705 RepID=A0A5M3N0C6_CONPW|nr:uncharacterized protein CONPUDRAFT_134710 [Coniophora puteana RWD-64-598 SS2]EIW84839.1 hypothetical protein CONPUDRAFT_134710 [Coniophora puteana RWD-64-598 SS2]